MRELEFQFQGSLPEASVNECRVASHLPAAREDPLRANEHVKALCFDLNMLLECI